MKSENYNRNNLKGPDRTITKIRITDEIRTLAYQRANQQNEKNYSGLGPEADFKGCLGEVVVEYWMEKVGIDYEAELNNRRNDYRLKNSLYTFDVKTKDRNFQPVRSYDCTVPFYNHTYQDSHFFYLLAFKASKMGII